VRRLSLITHDDVFTAAAVPTRHIAVDTCPAPVPTKAYDTELQQLLSDACAAAKNREDTKQNNVREIAGHNCKGR